MTYIHGKGGHGRVVAEAWGNEYRFTDDADGTVTASFYHKRGTVYPEDPNGCEWHVWIKLADWTGEDIPPDPK